MAVQLTPLHDRVIVKRIEEKESVKGGIIIPDSAKEKPMEGEIIAVGAGNSGEAERSSKSGQEVVLLSVANPGVSPAVVAGL